MSSDGRVEISTGLDASGIEEGLKEIVAKMGEVVSSVKSAGQQINDSITSAMKNAGKSASDMEEKVKSAGDVAKQKMNDMSDKIKTVSDGMKSTGDAMSKYISLPIAGVGVAAVKMSTDLNSAMANVATLIPDNSKRVNELKGNVQDMSMAFGKSTGDIADGLYQVISTFGDTSDTSKILADNVKAAAAGMATTTDAINLTAAVSKGYNDTSETTIKHITDLAFQTANLGITTFPELSKSIGGVTPLAATLGIKMEDMFAVFATGSGITGDTSQVATQFQNILQSLMAPTTAMTKLYKDLGYANGEAMLKSLGLQGTINKIVDTAKASNQPLQNYIGSIDGQTLALALNGNLSKGFTDNLKAMGHVAGSTDAAFKQQTQGVNKLGFEWAQAKAKGQVFLQQMGDAMAPVLLQVMDMLKPLTQGMAEFAKSFQKMSPTMKEVVMGFVAFIVAIGPVLSFIGRIGVGISTLVRWFAPLSAAIAEAGGIIPALGMAFSALTGPIGLTILAIVGLVAAGIAIYTHWGQIKSWLSNLWKGISQEAISIWGSITAFFSKWGTIVKTAVTGGLASLTAFFVNHWNQLKAQTMAIFNSIGSFFVRVWSGVKAIFSTVIGAIINVALNLWRTFGPSIMQIFNGIKTYISGWWTLLKNVFLGAILLIIDLVTGNWSRLKSDSIQIWQNILNAIQQIWEGIKQMFQGALNFIVAFLETEWTGIKVTAEAIWNGLKYAVQAIVEGLKNAIVSAWEGIKSGVSSAMSWIKSAVPSAWESVKSAVSNAATAIWDAVTTAFTNLYNSVVTWMSKVPDEVSNGFNSALDFLRSINLYDIGVNIIEGLINGVGSMIGAVKDKIKGVANSISSTIRGVLHINSPSRVMRDEVGKWIPAGIAEGIEANMDVVVKSTNRMGQKAIPVMPQTLIQQNKQIMQVKTASQKKSTQPMNLQLVTADGREMARWMIDDINDLLDYKNGRAKLFKQN